MFIVKNFEDEDLKSFSTLVGAKWYILQRYCAKEMMRLAIILPQEDLVARVSEDMRSLNEDGFIQDYLKVEEDKNENSLQEDISLTKVYGVGNNGVKNTKLNAYTSFEEACFVLMNFGIKRMLTERSSKWANESHYYGTIEYFNTAIESLKKNSCNNFGQIMEITICK